MNVYKILFLQNITKNEVIKLTISGKNLNLYDSNKN